MKIWQRRYFFELISFIVAFAIVATATALYSFLFGGVMALMDTPPDEQVAAWRIVLTQTALISSGIGTAGGVIGIILCRGIKVLIRDKKGK